MSRTDSRDERLDDSPTVKTLFEEALEDTKIGGDLERGRVTAMILQAVVLEAAADRIAKQLERIAADTGGWNK